MRAGRLSPVEVVDAVLTRIEWLNPALNAYYTVTAEAARADARGAEAALARGGPTGPLCGVPVSIKDLILTAGVRTTRGSRMFADFVPVEDAPVVQRLKAAGAIVIGKTATSEFGWKAVTDNPLFGVTRNPWNPDRTPGGSSGGAAVAVAAGLGTLAVATDAGGSTRLPASFCNVFGMKPSFGRVPVYPAAAADTLVHLGVISGSVADAALMLTVISGPDERDRNSLPTAAELYPSADAGDLRGLRVAWSPDLGYLPVDPEIRKICQATAQRFRDLGCEVEEANPGFADPDDVFRVLFYGSFGGQLADALPKWCDRLDPGLVEVIDNARSLTAFDVAKAGLRRAALWDAVRRFFERYDLLLTPVAGIPPFALAQNGPPAIAGRPVTGTAWWGFAYPFNLTGQPAASVPCGYTADNLPVGLQIVGRRCADATVLRAAAAFEAMAPWTQRRPALDSHI